MAFTRPRRGGGVAKDILVADARGRIVRNLTARAIDSFDPDHFNSDPAWSPDGSRIAYTIGWRGSMVAVIGAGGGRFDPIEETAGGVGQFARQPTWSPDGREIVYGANRAEPAPPPSNFPGLYVVRPDETGARLFVAGAVDAAFSPDGSSVAYVRAEDGPRALMVANADGSGARVLVEAPVAEPSWSPDGRTIAFTRETPDGSVIAVVRPDGSGERIVVRSARYQASEPAWRPAVRLPTLRRRPCA